MDRREFFTLTGATVAGATLPKATLAGSLGNMLEMRGPLFLPANGAPGGARSASVRNTSEFMEDYTSGQPLNMPSRMLPASQTPYITRAGKRQFFTYFNWSADSGVTQVHRDPASPTGWRVLINPLQREPGGPRNIFAVFDVPQAAIIPGAGDTPDYLWLYRTTQVLKGAIDANGALSSLSIAALKLNSLLLTDGQQPAGTRYLVELTKNLNTETHAAFDGRPASVSKHGVLLRDANPLAYPAGSYFTGGDAFINIGAISSPTIFGRQIFPLRDVGEGFYRCITLTDDGDVYSVLVTLDTSRPDWPIFQPREKVLLGHTASGCACVVEPVPGQVEVLLFDLPGVTSIRGVYQPGSRQAARWSAPTQAQVPLNGLNLHPSGRVFWIDAIWNAAQRRVEVFVMDRDLAIGKMDVWGTWRATDGRWDAASLIERDCSAVQAFDSQRVALLIGKPGTGYEILQRNPAGLWESEYIRVPLPPEPPAGVQAASTPTPVANAPATAEPPRQGGMAKIACYRVGINLTSAGVPMGGQTLRVTASAPTQAVLQGDRYAVLSTVRETEIVTDSSGVAWINVILQERLCFPMLYVKSACFAGQLKLDLNQRVEQFFVNLTSDKLRDAVDKDTGRSLVPNPQNLDGVVAGIQQMMQVQKQNQARLELPPELHPLHSDVHAHWIPASFHGPELQQRLIHDPARCWSLLPVDGVLTFERLTPDQAALRIATLRGIHPSFFSDLISDVSDLASGVWSGVCSIVAAVVSGAEMVVHVVLNGIASVLTVVLHTVEQLMSAVTVLLDAAGFVLGMAVNWILEELGFAFDWKGIKHRRNLLRQVVEMGADKLPQVLPDPIVGARKLAGELQDVRQWLLQYRTKPSAAHPFGGGGGSGIPGLPDIFSLSGKTVLPQVTWLLDKVKDKLLSSIAGPDAPDIDTLAQAQTALFLKVADAGDRFNLSMGDLESMILDWAGNGDLFGSSSLQAVLNPLLARLDSIIELLEDLILVAGQALHELWAHPRRIVEWLDTKIEIPFLSGFYRGLTGNDLSLFDVTCLLAAIPGSVHGIPLNTPMSMALRQPEGPAHLELAVLQRDPHAAPYLLNAATYAAADRTELQTLGAVCASLFMGIGIFTASIDASMIASGGTGDALDALTVTRINLGMSIFAGLSMVFAGGVWQEEVAIPGLLAAGGVLFFVGCPRLDKRFNTREGRFKGWIGDFLLVGLNSYFFAKSIKDGDDKAIAYNALGLVEVLAIAVMREAVAQGKKLPEPYPLVFGGVIGAMRVSREGLFIANSFSS